MNIKFLHFCNFLHTNHSNFVFYDEVNVIKYIQNIELENILVIYNNFDMPNLDDIDMDKLMVLLIMKMFEVEILLIKVSNNKELMGVENSLLK